MSTAKIIRIKTVAEFVDIISAIPLKEGHSRFFRGHADYKQYKLLPSIYRHPNLIANEHNMIQEAIIRCPSDFPESSPFFEHLVKLQHYGLPTRLVDLTSNALAALYFACREKEKTEGEVIIFDIPKEEVKYYGSDTVSILANIAKRPTTFDLRHLPTDKVKFNEHIEILQLLHDIRADKPTFLPIIEPAHLGRVMCVRAKLDNARINRQDGAFLIFGIKDNKKQCSVVPKTWIVCGNDDRRIIFSNKHYIKRQLDHFGVSEQTLFPELDSQTKSIVEKFKGKYKKVKKKV
jgi:hypothetical protein